MANNEERLAVRDDKELDFFDMIHVILDYKWLIILPPLALASLMYIFMSFTPVSYEYSILLSPGGDNISLYAQTNVFFDQQLLIRKINGGGYNQSVIDRLQLESSNILSLDARSLENDSSVICISLRGGSELPGKEILSLLSKLIISDFSENLAALKQANNEEISSRKELIDLFRKDAMDLRERHDSLITSRERITSAEVELADLLWREARDLENQIIKFEEEIVKLEENYEKKILPEVFSPPVKRSLGLSGWRIALLVYVLTFLGVVLIAFLHSAYKRSRHFR